MCKKPTYKQFGERTILIEWEAKIDEEILADITSFRDKVQVSINDKIQDCIVGYNSLTVIFKEFINFTQKLEVLRKIYSEPLKQVQNQNYLWQIPVCYDLEFGIDLENMSEVLNLSIEEIIKLHTKIIHTVFFIGFLPGFLYLGGLDKELHFPRKSNPRLAVKKGAVAIGGTQTGIYPIKSAGGWNIIGNSPINFFDIEKEQPCFAKSGDKIQFNAINQKEYENIKSLLVNGEYQLSKIKLND